MITALCFLSRACWKGPSQLHGVKVLEAYQSAMYTWTPPFKLGSSAIAFTVSNLSSTKCTVAFCSFTIGFAKICLHVLQDFAHTCACACLYCMY